LKCFGWGRLETDCLQGSIEETLLLFTVVRDTENGLFACGQWVFFGLGAKITLNPDQGVVLKIERELFLFLGSATFSHCVDVIPTVLMEGVYQEWCAENIFDLAFVHPGAQFIHHLLSDDVTLLNVLAIHKRGIAQGIWNRFAHIIEG